MGKILYIITKSEIGGAQKFVKEQICISRDNGFECFLATNQKAWLTDAVEGEIVDSLIDCRIENISFSYLMTLVSFIRKNKIDLIVCNSANAGFYGRIAAFFARIKSIYVSHGWSSIYNGGPLSVIFNKIEWFLSLFTSNILCVSENDLRLAKEVIGISSHKLTMISNAIKPIESAKIGKSDRSCVKVLSVARLQKPKRIDLLVDAVKNIGNVELTIVGEGAQVIVINEMILKENIGNVRMLGRIDGFSEFADYDIFALISDSEGLPLSALEAMSLSNALVVSSVGGCPELVDGNGVLVENNITSIKLGINLCIENLHAYKARSLELFNEKFNLDLKQREYIKYYKQFCS